MSDRITKISALPVRLPLKKPYVLSCVTQYAAEYVVVRLETQNGVVGCGECAPFPGETEETQKDIVSAIRDFLAPAVVGQSLFDLEQIHLAMNLALPKRYFAKSGIDFAIYDAIGKTHGVRVAELIGGVLRPEVEVLGGMGLPENGSQAAQEAEKLARQGFKTIKMKIGRGLRPDLENVAAVRSAVGDGIEIRVDANQAYSSAEAIRNLRALEQYRLSLIEQPLPLWDMDGMAKVAAALDTPIMADEPVYTPQDVLIVHEKKAADIVKIKAMRCGGIFPALKLCAVAEACGLPVVLGSGHESSIGVLAELHLAAASRAIP
ncbi:MAG: dipeptide epimerase, partial [Gracilibacteraceae bacterium]|nr:dipeptide epimerase [Gracilibacteraceae bacterium]